MKSHTAGLQNKLGDSTAKMLGRLTMNPLKHIDLVVCCTANWYVDFSLATTGTPFAFSWAKPIPVNTRNLKQPRRDMAIVAVGGPLANFFMAIFWAIMFTLLPAYSR